MGNKAIVKQGGPFIEVSADGQQPLSPQTYTTLEQPLYYTHLTFEYGAGAYDPATGVKHGMRPERRRLFQYDVNGRFVCQKGFYPRIRALLVQMGYEVIFVNKDEVKPEKIYTANWDRIFERFELRPRQDDCLAQIDMHDYGLIDAPPAFGKMHLMAMVACMYPYAKIDIVTKRKDVVGRIKTLLTRWVPSVGMVGGGKKDRNRRVTVYTADSMHHSDFDADIMMADESHELMTDRLAEMLSRYWKSKNYCFTATPDTRMDNAHYRMEGIFGPCIFRMTQQEAEQLGLVSHIYVQWLDVDCGGVNPAKPYQTLVAKKRHGIWRNQWRNQAIAESARSFLKDKLQVLILVDTVDHALHLKQCLPEATLCYSEGAMDGSEHASYVRAGVLEADEFMTSQRRVELRQKFERREIMCVIATGVWSTGVSFDSLNVLIRGDGGDSDTFNVQVPGRVCRIHPESGKEAGIMVDINDKWDQKFQGRSDNRRRSYHKRGWTQILSSGVHWNPGKRGRRAPI